MPEGHAIMYGIAAVMLVLLGFVAGLMVCGGGR
jgi:hypothetical protein